MFPPSLRRVADLVDPWWVAHTRPRCEKALARDLAELNVGYFLPLVGRVIMSGGRKRHTLIPLFTSYMFFCGDAQARLQALGTGRIANAIPVHEHARAQFVGEMTVVERAVSRQLPLNLHPFATVGKRCRIAAGPLEGVEGTVVSRNGQAHLVLNVSFLGQGATVTIEGDLLEPAH